MDLWARARATGSAIPTCSPSRPELLAYAAPGLERLDVRDSKGRTEARFLDSLDRQVARGATPAGDALAKFGDEPGRDAASRRAVVDYFTFAGKLG